MTYRFYALLVLLLVLSPSGAALSGVTGADTMRQSLPPELPDYRSDAIVIVDVSRQQLDYYRHGKWVQRYAVSTAEKGVGNAVDSFQTPLGLHYVARKIGAGEPINAIFRARQPTGERATVELAPRHLDEDLVTSRIIWLAGLEEGVNRGPGVDSFERYIYIHGTPEEGLIGQPASHGCIRMKNADIIELFDQLPERALVWIIERSGG